MPDTSAMHIIATAVTDQLIEVMSTDVDVVDETRANIVKQGKLQADPVTPKVTVLIMEGGEDWPHILNTNTSGPFSQDTPYNTGGIGGYSSSWRRRFKIELKIFWTNEYDRNESHERARIIVSRAQWAINSMRPPTDRDTFGERCYSIHVVKDYLAEGGGPGTFKWRVFLFIEAITDIEVSELP